MKRRIELNKRKRVYFIKALKKRGFHPEHVKVWKSREGFSFKISETPDFLWGIWERTWRTTDFWIGEYTEDQDYLDDGKFGLVKKGTFLLRVVNKKSCI